MKTRKFMNTIRIFAIALLIVLFGAAVMGQNVGDKFYQNQKSYDRYETFGKMVDGNVVIYEDYDDMGCLLNVRSHIEVLGKFDDTHFICIFKGPKGFLMQCKNNELILIKKEDFKNLKPFKHTFDEKVKQQIDEYCK